MVLLILVPLALFALLFVYLRRMAPGGVPKGEAGQATEDTLDETLARIPGARLCSRCGIQVRPVHGMHGIECPNCGSGMTA